MSFLHPASSWISMDYVKTIFPAGNYSDMTRNNNTLTIKRVVLTDDRQRTNGQFCCTKIGLLMRCLPHVTNMARLLSLYENVDIQDITCRFNNEARAIKPIGSNSIFYTLSTWRIFYAIPGKPLMIECWLIEISLRRFNKFSRRFCFLLLFKDKLTS
ncbi:MAG: hypothetical protein JWP06_676 [Candidatus Saccharibacteria bacterium]|nr:hypothetical protein [Candidatus Saccharibacteria bacterium]